MPLFVVGLKRIRILVSALIVLGLKAMYERLLNCNGGVRMISERGRKLQVSKTLHFFTYFDGVNLVKW